MKLSIPRQSLFGLLLRSPWWISIILALTLSALAAALIPRQYAFFAIVGTFPILFVGFVAAWRQLRTPSETKRNAALATARQHSWEDFSKHVQQNWRQLGYHVSTPGHAGADWRISREGQYTLVYARRWKAAVHGLEPFRQLATAMQSQGLSRGLYIAGGGEVSPPALRYAREHNIQIWLGDSLALLLLGKQPPENTP